MTTPSVDDDELMQAPIDQSVRSLESGRLHLDTAKVSEQRLQSEQVSFTQQAKLLSDQLKGVTSQLKDQEQKCAQMTEVLNTETHNYQVKFSALLMKNVLNEMLHAQDRSVNAEVIKAFLKWRQTTQKRQRDERVLILKQTFQHSILKLVRTLSARLDENKFLSLRKIQRFASFQTFKKTLSVAGTEEEKTYKRKILEVNAQLTSMQQKHSELEAYIEELMQKERNYKEEIKSLAEEKKAETVKVAALQAQTRRMPRTKAKDLAERVQDLEEENRDMRDKVDSMESNVTSFLKEMSALLDHSSYQGGQGEEGHTSEEDLRRPKRR